MMATAGDAGGEAERWPLHVGVLGLQGAFAEHVHVLERRFAGRVAARIVRTRADLAPPLDALILPGGESTSMSIMAERFGLLEDLRQWVASGRPIMVGSGMGGGSGRAQWRWQTSRAPARD